MLLADLFQETSLALTSNKVRSSLTVLGIVIGIASVIAMMSIGQGAQTTIESNIQALGSNLLVVTPGSTQGSVRSVVSSGRGSATTLTEADAEAITALELAKSVAPELSGRHQIIARGTNTNTSVIGTTVDYQSVRKINMAEGSFLSDQNNKARTKVAVLGPTTRDDLFGEGASVIGQKIRINKIDFTIIGVTESRGGTGFFNQDDVIFIPLSTAQQFISGSDYVSNIDVEANDQTSMTALQQQITVLLLARHQIKDAAQADFTVVNQADIASAASETTQTFTLLLGAIGGISLLVGGIGIMNMMLTTVTERTREIGLRKAIGAKPREIRIQFLTEAVMLTFLGGLIGTLIGWLASMAIGRFGSLTTDVSLNSILLAFGVSAAIGIIFGYYPASRASRLNPIEALRYE